MAKLDELTVKIEVDSSKWMRIKDLTESLVIATAGMDTFSKSFTIEGRKASEIYHKLGTDLALLMEKDSESKGEYIMAKKMSKDVSPFKKGRKVGGRSTGGSQFIGLKDGENVVFAPLVGLEEMIHADMHEYWDIRPAIFHPCIGKDCPGEAAGNEPRFKGYLPVLKKDGDVMVFPFTVSVYNQLEELEDEIDGDLKGYMIKFSRRGSGFSTKYSVLGVGKRVETDGVEIPDFVSQLGPQTKKEILELLEANDVSLMGEESATAETSTSDKLSETDEEDDWDV